MVGAFSGSCPIADIGISGAELLGPATSRVTQNIIEFNVTMYGEWDWLGIVSNSGMLFAIFCYESSR
jgi:hypothetical protein